MNLFQSVVFWMVKSSDFIFELTLAAPERDTALLHGMVDQSIKARRFA